MARRGPTRRTLRRAAILRELASLGFHAAKAGRMVGMREVRVSFLRKQFGITFPPGPTGAPRDEDLHRAVEEGFAAGLSPTQIATLAGSTAGSIRVLLSRKKLRYGGEQPDPGIFRRGFAVPVRLRDRYRELRKLGLTMQECGYELGLVERPKPGAPDERQYRQPA